MSASLGHCSPAIWKDQENQELSQPFTLLTMMLITKKVIVYLISFLKYKFIYVNWRLITILYWFCHTSTWINHRYTRVPHPEPPSLLPPRTIPLGRPSAPAPSIQYHASNLGWRLISYMILYKLNHTYTNIVICWAYNSDYVFWFFFPTVFPRTKVWSVRLSKC